MKETQKHNVLFQHHVAKLLRRKAMKSGFTVLVTEKPEQIESDEQQQKVKLDHFGFRLFPDKDGDCE